MLKVLLIASLLLPLPLAAFEEPDHETHQELRAILATVENAINSGNYDAMLPVLSENIRATTITQEVISSRAEASAYFKKWFGPGGFLKKLDMHFTADALTELSADKTWGLVRGSGIENYTLSDGRKYAMKTRWTAVVVKEGDGKWRLRAIHIGTNFLDNPILTEASRKAKHYTAAGTGAGLLVGLFLGFLFGRRKQ
jgi:ketosteroid isomerase-like protein